MNGSRSARTAPSAAVPGAIPNGLFEKYEVIRGAAPPVIVLLMKSKLKSSIIASRRPLARSRSTPLASVTSAPAPISRSPKPARAAMQVWRCCAV